MALEHAACFDLRETSDLRVSECRRECSFDPFALFCRPSVRAFDVSKNDRAAAARGGEKAGIRQLSVRAGNRVEVDSKVIRELADRGQLISDQDLASRNKSADLPD